MPSVTRTQGAAARERRADVEQQVLEAVERLLAAGESYTALGIQRIAAEAGMARTTFYGHFADKATLLMRLTDSATTTLFGLAGEWVADADATLESHERLLARLIHENRAHAPLLRAANELAAYDPEVARWWREKLEGFAAVVTERLRADVDAGRVPADLEIATTAAWIVWGTERTIAMHIAAHPDGAGDDALARGIAQATWGAMRRAT